MPESTYADHLTDQQLGAAFRGALQLSGIMHEIGSGGTPSVGDLLRDVDHEVEKKFPEVPRELARRATAEQIKLYKLAVNEVFYNVLRQRDVLLDRVEEFFEEFNIDSAHDAVIEQLQGDTFQQLAEEEASAYGTDQSQLYLMYSSIADTVLRTIDIHGGAK